MEMVHSTPTEVEQTDTVVIAAAEAFLYSLNPVAISWGFELPEICIIVHEAHRAATGPRGFFGPSRVR